MFFDWEYFHRIYYYALGPLRWMLPMWLVNMCQLCAAIYFIYCAYWFIKNGWSYINAKIEGKSCEFDYWHAKLLLVVAGIIFVMLIINSVLLVAISR